jgi:hypothetical protein
MRAVGIVGAVALLALSGCGGGGGDVSRGSLCGTSGIEGSVEGRVSGRLPGCGIRNAVSVTRVAGVELSTPALMTCDVARALHRWVARDAKDIVGRRGGGLESLQVINGYSCRTVNSRPGGKISEHGKGKAIDIAAFGLRDGSSISVLRGWRDRTDGPVLRRLHRAACGPFSTVLGPDADRFHQDHFHLDRRGGGAYCR